MPAKSFSIYNHEKSGDDSSSNLILEIGNSHIAAVVARPYEKAVAGFELFTFGEREAADFETLFRNVSLNSALLQKTYSATQIYFNNEYSLPVPVSVFDKEIAVDYMNLMFGEDAGYTAKYDYVAISSDIVNVYRIPDDCLAVLHRTFPKITFQHSYSNIIKSVTTAASSYSTEFIAAQFYNTHFIVAVMKNKQLVLIRSFAYENPEDVLYHLLNICNQFELESNLTVQISGMVHPDFHLYRELIRYFKRVEVKNADTSRLLIDVNEYPLHYFTPFFNLAV